MGAFTAANLVNLTLRVVLAAVLAPRLGIRMVWYAVPVGWAANYLISFLRYRTGRWRERGAGCWPDRGRKICLTAAKTCV